ncbi:hypothetical protein NESM_000662800 [Novymonas esmeraldas]|uniref:Autophagy-related protein 2 n=1 Tax=Novymonas esmeraldas TaxID=1808958 RepID=A0AAW0ETV0_9TRYP
MNFVNTYLLLPLQRKIFKNFGHYDYQTSTFHLNEERVNEVFFDPAYNPFVDVLRETSHASAVASAKAAAAAAAATQQQQQQQRRRRRSVSTSSPPPPPRRGAAARDEGAGGALSSSPAPPCGESDGVLEGAVAATASTASAEEPARSATAPHPGAAARGPPLRLLIGRIRSAGLVTFLRRVTTQKSLAVESVEMVFDAAAAVAAAHPTSSPSHTTAVSPVSPLAGGAHEAGRAGTDERAASPPPDADAATATARRHTGAEEGEGEEERTGDREARSTGGSLASPRRQRRGEATTMAHSYSIEDHSWLTPDADAVDDPADSGAADLSDGGLGGGSPTSAGALSAATPFHTVGELVMYLKQQLQGLTVEVEEVRLTVCVPPAGAAESVVRGASDATHRGGRPPPRGPASASRTPLRVRRGTRVLHLSCRRGLRFTVDESGGAAAEDMQCTAALQDWQCYVHVMADEGPLPSAFPLDDLVFATSAAQCGAETATGAGESAGAATAVAAPVTVRVTRQGGGVAAPAGVAAPSLPRVLVDVDAACGWSAVLSAVQVAHLVDMLRSVVAGGDAAGAEGSAAGADTVSTATSTSDAVDAPAEAGRQAAPLSCDEAAATAAPAATPPRTAAKYVRVHCGGCSVTLLTHAVVSAGVVARAWRAALSAPLRALLDTRLLSVAAAPHGDATVPVYEALASPHLTYAMRDVDILFPNIDADAPPPPPSTGAPSPATRVFQQSAKKRRVYRRIFDNKLADPAVTEMLATAQAAATAGVGGSGGGNSNSTGATFFLGIGAISFLEYRSAALGDAAVLPGPGPLPWSAVRPARLMHAERSPYACVMFHRSTPPLREAAAPPSSGKAPSSSPLRIYQETIIVGVANISVQLDPGLLEALVEYGITLKELIARLRGAPAAAEGAEGGAATVPLEPGAAAGAPATQATPSSTPSSPSFPSASPSLSPPLRPCGTREVRTRSSVKVLLESIDVSVRFPLQASPTAAAQHPALLARLLHRLREVSAHTHHRNRVLLRRHARQTPGRVGTLPAAGSAAAAALAEQERLGFPEDVDGHARFFPELLRFSLRDLQVEHTPTTAAATPRGSPDVNADASTPVDTAAAASGVSATVAAGRCVPASTAVKWREAVVDVQDIVEQNTSELFRVDYSREMSICITHTSLDCSGGSTRTPWRALERVLALQVRLGEITSSALTQDDYLLSSHYMSELLHTLSRCRQRLHAGETATAANPDAAGAPPLDEDLSSAAVAAADGRGVGVDGRASANGGEHAGRPPGAGQACEGYPALQGDRPTSTLAEAFAIADELNTSCSADGVGGRGTARLSSASPQGDGDDAAVRDVVPALWCLLATTCTSLDIHVSRVRLGLFAPRLSPMGQVVGEPLYRCLPRAQRAQLVDLNFLYHLYVMELTGVSVRALVGDGTSANAGQATYARVRVGGFSLRERQPLSAPSRDGRGAAGSGAAGAPSLFTSYVSAAPGLGGTPAGAPPPGTGTRRDLAFYFPRSHTAPTGARRAGTVVHLVQSCAEARGGAGGGVWETAGEEGEQRVDVGRDGPRRPRSARVLSESWAAYVCELQSVAAPLPPPARVSDGGVCEVCFLEATAAAHVVAGANRRPGASPPPPPAATAAAAATGAAATRTAADTRRVWLQLANLALHHAVAYNGDHLAAVLRQFFSGGDGAAMDTPGEVVAYNGIDRGGDGGDGDSMAAGAVLPDSPTDMPQWQTEVRVSIVNLMATYRPRGVVHSLAVLLLPRAAVLVELPPAPAPPASATEATRRAVSPEPRGGDGGAAARPTATPLPPTSSADVSPSLAVRAQAWLHTALPLYVCNDCDVETLMREILDPAESDDWGVDLESAGFVRLCELVSTAAAAAPHDRAAAAASPPARLPMPNLVLAVRSPSATAPVSSSGSGENSAGGGDVADCVLATPAVSAQLQHVELSAFMAKDTFAVFRDMVETWGAGADLEATEAPAALVMRSGPGFEWVAEEVARSCAPMTFRMNPYLKAADSELKGGSSGAAQPSRVGVPPLMRHVASVDDYTSHLPLLRHTASSQTSYTVEPPWAAPELSLLGPPAVHTDGRGAARSAFRSSATAYDYNHWLDTLHASLGRDPHLYSTYQARAIQLLDGAPWVPVRHESAQGDHSVVSPPLPPAPLSASSRAAALASPRQYADISDAVSLPSSGGDDCDDDDAVTAARPRQAAGHVDGGGVGGGHRRGKALFLSSPPRQQGTNASATLSSASSSSSSSSSFSDLEDTVASTARVRWRVLPPPDLSTPPPHRSDDDPVSDDHTRAAPHIAAAVPPALGGEGELDLFSVCARQPHFLCCWSSERVKAARQHRDAVRLNQLDRTDDAILHDSAERYLYPPVELEFFLSDCSVNVSLYEGTDLMAAAVRKQRRGYLQIVSRGASLAQAAPYASGSAQADTGRGGGVSSGTTATAAPMSAAAPQSSLSALHDGRTQHSLSKASGAATDSAGGESSASRLERLHERGSRSGFGDRNASKRLVLSCRDITVQLDTFPQAAEEDVWFNVVVGEVTVFDCIDTSRVHRLLTATPQLPASSAARAAEGGGGGGGSAAMPGLRSGGGGSGRRGGVGDVRQLELTGLLTSSKSVHVAAVGGRTEASRASFTVSHFQQGGSELSLVVRLQPTSLTWSGASVDFARVFFAATPPPASPSSGPGAAGSASAAPAAASAPAPMDAGTVSGTEAPPLFYRRVIILPTTLTMAGSFESDKGMWAAWKEGHSLDALRSIPLLSWISLDEIPLPIPLMRVEDCSNAGALLQRIVEDSNCISIRFLLTACCCGLQPLSAVTRVGEAARGLLLLPLSNYRGAALHHAIRTASSVFMQELLTQTSGMAALLASGSYHASRSLLEVLVSAPPTLTVAEPSRAAQPIGVAEGWQQGQEQLRVGLQEALAMASYCTDADGGLLRVPAAALRLLMGISGAATTTLWGVRNSQGSAARERDGHIYKQKM